MSQADAQITELIKAARRAKAGALDHLLDLYRNYLRLVLAHNIADLGRRYRAASRQVSREMSLEDAMRSSSDAMNNFVAGEASSPSHAVQRRETTVMLADALAELSPDHREVIILRNIEELDWPDIAEKMDRTPDAVRVLWARALKHLRPLIEKRL